MGLQESLEEDMKKANMNEQGEIIHEEPKIRTRTRKPGRDAVASPPDEDETPQEDDEKSSGDSESPSGDDGAPRKPDEASPGSEGILKPEEKPAEDEKPLTPQEAAYHRRKAREAEAENKRLKQELEAAKRYQPEPVKEPAKTETKIDNPEPNKDEDLAGWLVWNAEEQRKWRESEKKKSEASEKQRQIDELYDRGYQEVDAIQNEYKKTNPDYDNAIAHAKESYKRAVKTIDPRLTDAQIEKAIKQEILNIAVECTKNGTNLGETLYDMAIERFGYEPKDAENEEVAQPKPKATNLRVVASNKRRSASSLEGGGQKAAGRITMEQAAQMSPAELQALPAEDWAYLESIGF